MKKYFLFIVFLFSTILSFSQWTDSGTKIYQTTLTDSVGIGLTNPNNIFQAYNLINFDNATSSTSIGQNAGINNSAIHNVFVGYLSGNSNTSGKNNVFMGESSGIDNTTGDSNTFLGRKAGESNTTGRANTFLGKESGRENISGTNNTAFGAQSLKSNQIGSYNASFGNNALINATQADSNCVFGFAALGTAGGTYNGNVVIGFEAGEYASNINGCVLLGFHAGYNNTVSNRLMIDNTDTETPLIDGNFDTNELTINGTLGLTTGASVNEFSVDGTMSGNSDSALCTEKAIVTYVNNKVSSSSVWQNTGNYIYQSSLTDSVGIGTNSPNNLFQVNNLINFDNSNGGTYLGQNSGINNTAIYNTFIGFESGKATTSGKQNVFIGYKSGTVNTTGKNNVFVGESAGVANTTGYSNTFLGRKAGESNTTGRANTFLGKESGRYNTTGTNNTSFGTQSLKSNQIGSYNTSFGNNALINATQADSNCVFGFAALGTAGGTYNGNVVIGFEAGEYASNINSCVLLGFHAGYNNTISNRLMIDNSDTDSPLIDGDFTKNVLTINDVLKLTPRSTAPSSPVAGMIYFSSSDSKLKVYDGSAWHDCY